MSVCAHSRVLLGVPAEACGLRQPPELAVPDHIPLSPSHSSLRPRSLKLARSPQRPQIRPIQIKDLRADESSGWIAALAGKVNCHHARRMASGSLLGLNTGQATLDQIQLRLVSQRPLVRPILDGFRDLADRDIRHAQSRLTLRLLHLDEVVWEVVANLLSEPKAVRCQRSFRRSICITTHTHWRSSAGLGGYLGSAWISCSCSVTPAAWLSRSTDLSTSRRTGSLLWPGTQTWWRQTVISGLLGTRSTVSAPIS